VGIPGEDGIPVGGIWVHWGECWTAHLEAFHRAHPRPACVAEGDPVELLARARAAGRLRERGK
jgi:hypothetical protein